MLGTFLIITKGNIHSISISKLALFWGIGAALTASMFAVIFVVLFGTLIAFYCYLESLKYIQPTEASVLSSVEPLSAAFLSIIWLQVHFGMLQWVGTVCFVVAIIILSNVKKEKSMLVASEQ